MKVLLYAVLLMVLTHMASVASDKPRPCEQVVQLLSTNLAHHCVLRPETPPHEAFKTTVLEHFEIDETKKYAAALFEQASEENKARLHSCAFMLAQTRAQHEHMGRRIPPSQEEDLQDTTQAIANLSEALVVCFKEQTEVQQQMHAADIAEKDRKITSKERTARCSMVTTVLTNLTTFCLTYFLK